MTRRLQGRAGSLIVQVAMGSVICVGFYVSPTFAQTTCPATPSELEAIIDNETDPEVRAEAAECFVEKAIDFSYPELKQLVHMMLKEEEPADVRFHGLAILGASLMAGESTGSDLWGSKSKIIKILKEDPIGQNKAAAAALISYMDPIPENQVEEPLLDLLSHSGPPWPASHLARYWRSISRPSRKSATLSWARWSTATPSREVWRAGASGCFTEATRPSIQRS